VYKETLERGSYGKFLNQMIDAVESAGPGQKLIFHKDDLLQGITDMYDLSENVKVSDHTMDALLAKPLDEAAYTTKELLKGPEE